MDWTFCSFLSVSTSKVKAKPSQWILGLAVAWGKAKESRLQLHQELPIWTACRPHLPIHSGRGIWAFLFEGTHLPIVICKGPFFKGPFEKLLFSCGTLFWSLSKEIEWTLLKEPFERAFDTFLAPFWRNRMGKIAPKRMPSKKKGPVGVHEGPMCSQGSANDYCMGTE